jgi:type II secretory pathway pseudopilin PulG
MVGITIMMILMGVALPTWKYIVKNDREEELISRLKQVQRAIERWQKRHGAPPTAFKALVEQRFLRRPYTDPMTKDGQWRLVRPGEPCGAGAPGGMPPTLPGGQPPPGATQPSPGPPRSATARPSPSPGPGGTPGQSFGGIIAVRTTLSEKSLRLVNGQSRYDQWCVQPGQELVVGKQLSVLPAPGPSGLRGGPRPLATPLPLPSPPS